MSRSSGARGPYAKGVARRREIIDVALEVLAAQGLRNSTLQEIAERVGITRPGLLHYFGSKEELVLAVLEERDTRDIAAAEDAATPATSGRGGMLDSAQRAVVRTKTAPGLARLYTELAAEATDPDHPAHEWFQRRYERIRTVGKVQIQALIDAGEIDPAVDVDALSQLLPALMDGLQLQWLLDPELDTMPALRLAVSGLVEHLAPPPGPRA